MSATKFIAAVNDQCLTDEVGAGGGFAELGSEKQFRGWNKGGKQRGIAYLETSSQTNYQSYTGDK